MNKKIIAIAIASAMAAPVAMADIQVSGQMGGALVSTDVKTSDPFSGSTRPIQESGYSKLQFDMTSGGSGYARGGLSLKNGYQGGSPTLRDIYFGVKGGWGSFQLGRMASALKNTEKDPYISTFLQLRGQAGVPSDPTENVGFVDGLVQYAGKMGPVDLTVQFNPMENVGNGVIKNDGSDFASGDQEGMTAIKVAGKAGPVNIHVAMADWDTFDCGGTTTMGDYDFCNAAQTSSGNTYTKLGANMKFGTVKATVQMATLEQGSGIGSTEQEDILVMADVSLGQGLSLNAAIGTSETTTAGAVTKDEEDFMRVAVTKNISKNTNVFGGYTSSEWKNGADKEEVTQLGVGLQVKF